MARSAPVTNAERNCNRSTGIPHEVREPLRIASEIGDTVKALLQLRSLPVHRARREFPCTGMETPAACCIVGHRVNGPAKFPLFDPVFPLFEHDKPDHGLTARTADRAVLVRLRRFLAGIQALSQREEHGRQRHPGGLGGIWGSQVDLAEFAAPPIGDSVRQVGLVELVGIMNANRSTSNLRRSGSRRLQRCRNGLRAHRQLPCIIRRTCSKWGSTGSAAFHVSSRTPPDCIWPIPNGRSSHRTNRMPGRCTTPTGMSERTWKGGQGPPPRAGPTASCWTMSPSCIIPDTATTGCNRSSSPSPKKRPMSSDGLVITGTTPPGQERSANVG